MKANLVLFDLDGTLLDTAPDLAYALNCQRQQHGLAELPEQQIRPYASHGTTGLLKVGFDMDKSHAQYAQYVEEYLAIYGQVFNRQPQLFAGISELLAQLQAAGIAWGVVTNKHRQFSQPLLESLGLLAQASCLICGNDVQQPKPAPEGLLKACQDASVAPQQAIYVGDAQRDIAAGIAAGMPTVVAMYGYLSEHDQPELWGANYAIQHPQQLMQLL